MSCFGNQFRNARSALEPLNPQRALQPGFTRRSWKRARPHDEQQTRARSNYTGSSPEVVAARRYSFRSDACRNRGHGAYLHRPSTRSNAVRLAQLRAQWNPKCTPCRDAKIEAPRAEVPCLIASSGWPRCSRRSQSPLRVCAGWGSRRDRVAASSGCIRVCSAAFRLRLSPRCDKSRIPCRH